MVDQLSGATRLFPIIGDPIKYVESPMRLTRTFAQRDHNGICFPMQVPAGELDTVMSGLTASRNVDGILVTMPHKFAAFGYCATSSKRARMLGVVSVIRRNPDSTWHGDMLDGLAFVKAQQDHGAELHGARVLLVGARAAPSPSPCSRRELAKSPSMTRIGRASPRCWSFSRTTATGP
jgi:shikimate dehydrogenase